MLQVGKNVKRGRLGCCCASRWRIIHWTGIGSIRSQFLKLFLHLGKEAQWESEEELQCRLLFTVCFSPSGSLRASFGKLQTHHCHFWRRHQLLTDSLCWKEPTGCWRLSVCVRIPFNTTFGLYDMVNYSTERIDIPTDAGTLQTPNMTKLAGPPTRTFCTSDNQ